MAIKYFSYANWEIVYGDSPYLSPKDMTELKAHSDGQRSESSNKFGFLNREEYFVTTPWSFLSLPAWMMKDKDESDITAQELLQNGHLQRQYWIQKELDNLRGNNDFWTPALIKSDQIMGFAMVSLHAGSPRLFELHSDLFEIPIEKNDAVDELLYNHRRFLPSGYLVGHDEIQVYTMHIGYIQEYINTLFPDQNTSGIINTELTDKYLYDPNPSFTSENEYNNYVHNLRDPYRRQCMVLLKATKSNTIAQEAIQPFFAKQDHESRSRSVNPETPDPQSARQKKIQTLKAEGYSIS